MKSSRRTSSIRARNLTTPAAYLRALVPEKREALQDLRATIKAAAPGLQECISYGLPAFRYNGKFLLAYGATAKHCAFYPGSVVQKMDVELRDYDLSKGTIRFPANKPLPKWLVRKLVRLRIAQRKLPRDRRATSR